MSSTTVHINGVYMLGQYKHQRKVHETFWTLSITWLTSTINWYSACTTVANTRSLIDQQRL